MTRRASILILVLVCFLSPLVMANDGMLQIKDGVFLIESPSNNFANIVYPLKLEKEPEELLVEMKIRVEGAPGASWGPGVYLYWDANKWISLRHSGSVFRMEGYIEGTWTREDKWSISPSGGWNGLRLVWQRDFVDVYASNDGERWHRLTDVMRPGKGLPWIIVGKGFGDGKGSNPYPYLANAHSDLGAPGRIYIKDVVVKVDGKLVLEETFKGDSLNQEVWVPIFSGDPKLEERIKSLDKLRVTSDLEGDGLKGVYIDNEALFDPSRWEVWRTRVQRPGGLYKEEVLARARMNIQTHPSGKDEINRLKNDVRLAMSYNEAQIAHMIPETTPTCSLFTPSPLSDLGFPHGSWSWSPERPDQIICQGSGRIFPNKDFPEDIEIVLTHGGKEQRLTFNRSKDWVFANFPLATSFTGNIRARKVSYMATQVEKLGLIYALTGEIDYAKQAKAILLRFAEVYPYYLVHSGYHEFADMDPLVAAKNIYRLPEAEVTIGPNKPNGQLHAGYWMAGRATGNGMEGTFLMSVTNAYDLVADARYEDGSPLFNEIDKMKVEKDLLLEGTKLLLCDPTINNKTVSARAAVAAVGGAIGDPLLVRWGYDGFNKILHEWFLSDGSTSESPAYGLMVLGSLWQLGEILHGYSDPEGYEDETNIRFDDLDIYREPIYQAVWQNMYLSMLPSTKYPPIADSYTTSTLSDNLIELMALRFPFPEFKSLLKLRVSPFRPSIFYRDSSVDLKDIGPLSLTDVLLPDWRLAYLRGGSRGMESTVILNMSDWGGHHHFDSLDLLYWKDGVELLSDLGYLWDNPKSSMTTRSIAHNLVVVDEANQRALGRRGHVHLFYPLGRFKVTEGSSRAYSQASIYRRFVAQIEHPGANSYVLDIFRVKGGRLHDYVYHGPGKDFKTQGIDFKNDDTNLASYQFINVKGASSHDWRIIWKVPNGYFQALTIGAEDERALIADGWGQRATKDPYTTLPFVIRRRIGENLESSYVSLYEGYKKKAMVNEAHLLNLRGDGASRPIGVAVNAGSYMDYILSSTEVARVEGQTEHGSLIFSGIAGVASFNNKNNLEILGLMDGREISVGQWSLILKGEPLEGEIYQSHENGFTIEGEYPELTAGQDVFVESVRMETLYPIRKVEVGDGRTRIYTQDKEGGFPFDRARTWRIPQMAYLERIGDSEYILKGTSKVQMTLPASVVSLDKLAYHLGDGEWKSIAGVNMDGWFTFTLSPLEGGGTLYLRLK